ncbi:MAG TPA: SMP-30/gluconolactonase/LRE family protein [Candidatus Acidoferrales bacterium]|jgi:gluconolactonase|nr:SMP-30/gluconolactonase/LRE family protein [Candidatus Acidoferrales bacterium]
MEQTAHDFNAKKPALPPRTFIHFNLNLGLPKLRHMKSLSALLLTAVSLLALTAFAADDYQPGPDSQPQAGVPKGDVLKFTLENSKIFPGSRHEYWVYVPAEYTPDKPACVYVGQDGVQDNAPVVFDNLISKREMPVTIGIFVKPGITPAANTNAALDRFNRSYEYDGLGDNYARFLLEEIFPLVEKITLPDGRAIHLSHNANDRAIGGQSSGAICAFTVAWERPQEFSRVFSAIGTYVDLRGGSRYPTLIRKYEPKAIRVFLQDGSNDNNKYGGDWWMANQTMQRALTFAGYEVTNIWGTDIHSGKHGAMVFPDAMRWLWKDWPQPVKFPETKNDTLTNILIPGEGWQVASENHGSLDGPAANAKGEVFFNDGKHAKGYKIALDGQVTEFIPDAKRRAGQAFAPDGRLFALSGGDEKIFTYDADGKPTVFAEGIHGNDIAIAHNGNIYVTDSTASSTNGPTKVWLFKSTGERQLVDSGLRFCNGVTLSPDQSLLYVADYRSHWVYSFVIQPDGTLADKQKYYWLHAADTDDDSGADGIRVDREGRLYVTTRMGIQVCDQAGRVQCILPTPNGHVSNLCFGGEKFDTIYATCGDKVYKRKLKVTGANAWDEPNKPTPPRL